MCDSSVGAYNKWEEQSGGWYSVFKVWGSNSSAYQD